MTTILSYLFEMTGLPEVEHAPPTAEQVSLERIEIYLKHNLEKPLRAVDVADYAGISTRSLQRLFQHAYQQGAMARLQTLRLHRAAQLLLETELTVTEISEQVGITGVSYFCRCFHRGFNMTPLEYRAKGTYLPLSAGNRRSNGLVVMPFQQHSPAVQTAPS